MRFIHCKNNSEVRQWSKVRMWTWILGQPWKNGTISMLICEVNVCFTRWMFKRFMLDCFILLYTLPLYVRNRTKKKSVVWLVGFHCFHRPCGLCVYSDWSLRLSSSLECQSCSSDPLRNIFMFLFMLRLLYCNEAKETVWRVIVCTTRAAEIIRPPPVCRHTHQIYWKSTLWFVYEVLV